MKRCVIAITLFIRPGGACGVSDSCSRGGGKARGALFASAAGWCVLAFSVRGGMWWELGVAVNRAHDPDRLDGIVVIGNMQLADSCVHISWTLHPRSSRMPARVNQGESARSVIRMSERPPDLADETSPPAKSRLARRLVEAGILSLGLSVACFLVQTIVMARAMSRLQLDGATVEESKRQLSDVTDLIASSFQVGAFTGVFLLGAIVLSVSGLVTHWVWGTSDVTTAKEPE